MKNLFYFCIGILLSLILSIFVFPQFANAGVDWSDYQQIIETSEVGSYHYNRVIEYLGAGNDGDLNFIYVYAKTDNDNYGGIHPFIYECPFDYDYYNASSSNAGELYTNISTCPDGITYMPEVEARNAYLSAYAIEDFSWLNWNVKENIYQYNHNTSVYNWKPDDYIQLESDKYYFIDFIADYTSMIWYSGNDLISPGKIILYNTNDSPLSGWYSSEGSGHLQNLAYALFGPTSDATGDIDFSDSTASVEQADYQFDGSYVMATSTTGIHNGILTEVNHYYWNDNNQLILKNIFELTSYLPNYAVGEFTNDQPFYLDTGYYTWRAKFIDCTDSTCDSYISGTNWYYNSGEYWHKQVGYFDYQDYPDEIVDPQQYVYTDDITGIVYYISTSTFSATSSSDYFNSDDPLSLRGIFGDRLPFAYFFAMYDLFYSMSTSSGTDLATSSLIFPAISELNNATITIPFIDRYKLFSIVPEATFNSIRSLFSACLYVILLFYFYRRFRSILASQ